MDDEEIIELAEKLARWKEEDILEEYNRMNFQNPYALVGYGWEEIIQDYAQMSLEELRDLYRIEIYKRAARSYDK